MKLRRLDNGDFEVITRKGNIYRAVDLHNGWYMVWDVQRYEAAVEIQYLDELFETISYREFHLN